MVRKTINLIYTSKKFPKEMPDSIVHVEIPVNDLPQLKKFYSEVFGWKFRDSKMPGMEYWLIDMGSKQIGGGMYKKTKASQTPLNYVGVKSIDSTIKKFKNAGGKIIMEKMEVPKAGWLAVGIDPSGNAIGFWQGMQSPPPKKASKKKK